MTDEEKQSKLLQEQQELRRMIGEGVTFDIDVTYHRRKPGFFGRFRKPERITEKQTYTIQEPTLSTLDRLSALWIQMEIDEARLKDDDYLATAKQLAKKEAAKLAEVVAVAVLGEDYFITTFDGTHYHRKEDKARLRELSGHFFHFCKPSELLTLAILITNVSNLGDFVNSMRLMCATRTSEPRTTRIEQPD